NVESVAATPLDLLGVDGDPNPDGPAPPGPLQQRPVPTADVQQPAARPALHLIQQVVVLVRLGLLERQLEVAMIDPLRQVEQSAAREQPIDRRVAGDDSPPRGSIRGSGIGRWLKTRDTHGSLTREWEVEGADYFPFVVGEIKKIPDMF